MIVIPKGVQLTKIQNTSDSHIVIEAQAYEMQQIAYFKTGLEMKLTIKLRERQLRYPSSR